jgi:hypothetical protein
MEKQNKIKKDWDIANATNKFLATNITEAEVDYNAIPEALIQAQKLNNQIDYFEEEYGIPNDVIAEEEFAKFKQERDLQYKKLYVIFDKLSNDDMIGFIKKDLEDRVNEYKIFVQDIEKSSDDYVLKMLKLRDEIKYLYDELDIWTGRWAKREERIETCDITDKFCQEIGGLDVGFRKFILADSERFKFIINERTKELIKKPDGSKRFDFWWWFVLD